MDRPYFLLVAAAVFTVYSCAPAPRVRPPVAEPGPSDSLLAELGRRTFREKGCMECHIREGEGGKSGPNLDKLAGVADPTYVRESILDPDAIITPGYEAGLMPPGYGAMLTEAEIDALQYYLSNRFSPAAK
ncbi:MAG: cytochrome c [Deltaproteobacteria bacterium]|nr:cytochrome c [Deltaproteobacteria bacterium]